MLLIGRASRDGLDRHGDITVAPDEADRHIHPFVGDKPLEV